MRRLTQPPTRCPAGTQSEGLRQSLIQSGLLVGALKIVSLLLGLAGSVLLARILGPQGYGEYVLVMAVLSVVAMPFDHGMRPLLTREVSDYAHQERWSLLRGLLSRTQQYVLVGLPLVLAAAGLIAYFRIHSIASDDCIFVVVAVCIPLFLGLGALRDATLRGLGCVVWAQLPEFLIRPGVHLFGAGTLVVFGLLTPETALLSQTLAVIAAFGVGSALLRRRLPPQAVVLAPQNDDFGWLRAWGRFVLLTAATLLNTQLGILTLGWLGTDEQIAALSIAARGAQMVVMSLVVVNLVIAPQITRAYRDHDQPRLQRLFTQSARAALLLALPVALSLILFAEEAVTLAFGSEYTSLAAVPLAVLSASELLSVMFGSVAMFLIMTGHERDTLLGQGLALVLNGVLCLVLIPTHGAEGAAWAAAISVLVCNLFLAAKIVTQLKVRPSFLPHV